ncbi:MAG: hypothetical protein ACK4SA_20185 [Caldilinea sp.]
MSIQDDLKPIKDRLYDMRRAASDFYNLSHISEPVEAAKRAFDAIDNAFSALLALIEARNTPHHQPDVVEDDEQTRRIEAQLWATARVFSAQDDQDDDSDDQDDQDDDEI